MHVHLTAYTRNFKPPPHPPSPHPLGDRDPHQGLWASGREPSKQSPQRSRSESATALSVRARPSGPLCVRARPFLLLFRSFYPVSVIPSPPPTPSLSYPVALSRPFFRPAAIKALLPSFLHRPPSPLSSSLLRSHPAATLANLAHSATERQPRIQSSRPGDVPQARSRYRCTV